MVNTLIFIAVEEKQLDVESLICNADNEGSTLLHLAVDSGILPVRHETRLSFKKYTGKEKQLNKKTQKTSEHSQQTSN